MEKKIFKGLPQIFYVQIVFGDYFANKAMVFLLFVLRIRRPSILGFWKKNKIDFTYFFHSRRLP